MLQLADFCLNFCCIEDWLLLLLLCCGSFEDVLTLFLILCLDSSFRFPLKGQYDRDDAVSGGPRWANSPSATLQVAAPQPPPCFCHHCPFLHILEGVLQVVLREAGHCLQLCPVPLIHGGILWIQEHGCPPCIGGISATSNAAKPHGFMALEAVLEASDT